MPQRVDPHPCFGISLTWTISRNGQNESWQYPFGTPHLMIQLNYYLTSKDLGELWNLFWLTLRNGAP